jgi:predicted aspartyl protease
MIECWRRLALWILLVGLVAVLVEAQQNVPPPSKAQAEEPIEIGFTTGSRGHILVDVVMNGGDPVPFAVDTGAGRTVLNQGRVSGLGLVQRVSEDTVRGAHEEFALGLADVETLAIGTMVLGPIELGTMDLSHIESDDMPLYGVLGFDVLSRFDIVLDLGNETVEFHPRAVSLNDCAVCQGGLVVPFELAKGTHIRFEVTISDQPIVTILDTGSGRSGMNHVAATAIGIDLPPTSPGRHGPAVQVGELRVGDGVLARNLIVGVVDLPVFAALGVADGPAMLMGTEALAGRRVGISYGVGRLSIR